MTQPHPKSSEFLYEMASRMRGRADVWKQLANRKRKQVEVSKPGRGAPEAWIVLNAELWAEFWRLTDRKMWCLLAAGRLNDAASRTWSWESAQRLEKAKLVEEVISVELPDAP